jgi:hypothetical protein
VRRGLRPSHSGRNVPGIRRRERGQALGAELLRRFFSVFFVPLLIRIEIRIEPMSVDDVSEKLVTGLSGV